MEQQAVDKREADNWLDEVIELRPGVELIRGADDEPMLFAPDRGSYVRLSETAARLTPLLDGTRTGRAIVGMAVAPHPSEGEPAAGAVATFLGDLRRAELLTVEPDALRGRRGLLHRLLHRRHTRLPLTYSLDVFLRRPAALLRRCPPRVVLWLVAIAGLASAVLVWRAITSPILGHARPSLAVLGIALLAHMTLHELSHALVCQALGVSVREAGVALWYLVLPVAYVDHTDAYRLRRRAHRAAIALAGPLFDLTAAGVSAAVSLQASGVVGGTARALLLLQVLLLLTNLNPLLPTDGHHAVAIAAGELNLRRRAFGYLGHRLLRLPVPAAVASASPRRRRVYAVYGMLAGGYVLCVLAGVALAAGPLIGAVR